MKDRIISLFEEYTSFIKSSNLKVNNMDNKEQETSNYGFNPHPDEFPGEDYPHSFKDEEYPPLASPEDVKVIKKFYKENPLVQWVSPPPFETDIEGSYTFNPEDAWIQTYTGRRFTPTNPNPDAIVIQDIAHSLSMQCRFGGHVKSFYSVAQHCVLVSHLCNFEDAFWGLLHDASEAYLVDLPKPLKHSGQLDVYKEFEQKVQLAICKSFGLPPTEPPSVKRADTILLVTEARDLLLNVRPDWVMKETPLPFKIDPLGPSEAKDLFMKRFFELTNQK